jgi:peroxiredoxin
VIGLYGALSLFGVMTRRVSYLISPEKRILDVVRADLSAKRHTAFVSHALAQVEG